MATKVITSWEALPNSSTFLNPPYPSRSGSSSVYAMKHSLNTLPLTLLLSSKLKIRSEYVSSPPTATTLIQAWIAIPVSQQAFLPLPLLPNSLVSTHHPEGLFLKVSQICHSAQNSAVTLYFNYNKSPSLPHSSHPTQSLLHPSPVYPPFTHSVPTTLASLLFLPTFHTCSLPFAPSGILADSLSVF